MKRIAIALLSLFLLATPSYIFAKDSNDENISILSSGEVINDDYFASGDSVEIYGTINGDAYVAGGQVIVDGTINGDLLVAGGSVIIDGDVTQDVRVAAGDVTLSGNVGRNVSLGAGQSFISESADIKGSVVAGTGSFVTQGIIEGNLRLGSGSAMIQGDVGGKIEAGVGEMRVTPRAQVAGDLTYWSDFDASIDEGATVGGTITRMTHVPDIHAERDARAFGRTYFYFSIISSLVVGLMLMYFTPKAITKTGNEISKSFWKSIGLGFLGLIVTPIIAILLFVPLVTIPLGFLLFSFYFISLYLSKFFFMYFAGSFTLEKIDRKKNSVYLIFFVGLIVYGILRLIPIINLLTSFVSLLSGFGALLITLFEAQKKAKSK